MRFSDVFAASLLAPLATAHEEIPGTPKLFGLKHLRARNPWAGHAHVGHGARSQLQARQGGNGEGRCGADGGGASCASGFCCSVAVRSLSSPSACSVNTHSSIGILWYRQRFLCSTRLSNRLRARLRCEQDTLRGYHCQRRSSPARKHRVRRRRHPRVFEAQDCGHHLR